MKKSELLLPVGNYQMCVAAIHNGADAVYVGMPEFNARGRSHDHSWDELKEIIQTCHLYGVKVHLAFNILIFENEIEKAITVLDKAVKLSPDALIVQDIGLISLIKKRYPKLEIHGSTQMSISNFEAIKLLDDLDIQRFVLARENTLQDMKIIKENTTKEIEVFVHGALCVAYSGQCFTSESLGGRSANRGQCAQSCRFPYEIFVDGKKEDLGHKKYLVSPQDLCGIDEIPELVKMGIDSFKVEGRLKSPDFVAHIAKNYQAKIQGSLKDTKLAKEEIGITYSRGLYSGWLHGVAHQELVRGDFKENRGAFFGKVEKVTKKEIEIHSSAESLLENGDGLLFVNPKLGDEGESGSKIYGVQKKGFKYIVNLAPDFNIENLKKGFDVYLTRKESLIKETKKSTTDRNLKKHCPVKIKINAQINKPLSINVNDGEFEFNLETRSTLEKAGSRPMTLESIRDELKGLSQSAYFINEINGSIDEGLYIHRREIKELKQEMVLKLNELRVNRPVLKLNEVSFQKEKKSSSQDAKLNILVRRFSQLEALLSYLKMNKNYQEKIGKVILDYEFGKDYFPSCELLRKAGIKSCIATTRVLKPGEYHNFKLIDRCKPDGILVRNLGSLQYFQESNYDLYGDFSLNCANSFTFDYLLNKKLKTQCLSYDLNIEQLESMMSHIDVSKAEVVIHQYMPEFHMEHCVFAAFLSEGNSFRDCGKPCEKHEVHLKDMYGNRHEIKADQECRNTMFNAKAVSTATLFDRWLKMGIGSFRFECLHETENELIQKIENYLKLMSGEVGANEVLSNLQEVESYGLGLGVLGKKDDYIDRKKQY